MSNKVTVFTSILNGKEGLRILYSVDPKFLPSDAKDVHIIDIKDLPANRDQRDHWVYNKKTKKIEIGNKKDV